MDQELKQYLDARFADVDRRAEATEDRLKALIEKTETNLLSAFYAWARPMEVRVQSVSTMVLGFD
jgi:hypothetical protein